MEALWNLFSEQGAMGGIIILETVALVYLWRDNVSLREKLFVVAENYTNALNVFSNTLSELTRKIKPAGRRKE